MRVPRAGQLLVVMGIAIAPVRAQDNFLIVIADDLGVDRVEIYDENPVAGHTPNIDRLAREGILFRNAWAAPACSAARALLMTGRYAFRTGVGGHIPQGQAGHVGLDPDLENLAHVMSGTYACAQLGKWHLATLEDGLDHPMRSGFRLHAGSKGGISSYATWPKVVNGVEESSSTYPTTDTTDDALRAIHGLPEPWLVWVAYNAPHKPFHHPPAHLHTYDLPDEPEANQLLSFLAATEAMDTELGRLLSEVDFGTTTVIFLGDNGTMSEAVTLPQVPWRAKGTVFEGGLRVPFIVTGSLVKQPGRESPALISAVDLLATLSEAAGVQHTSPDSVSFLPILRDPGVQSVRTWMYAEKFKPNGLGPHPVVDNRAIRGHRYKYMVNVSSGEERFYDLHSDPWEWTDLLPGGLSQDLQVHFDRLKTQIALVNPN